MSRQSRSTLREYVEAALWALVLTLFLRAFVIQAFRIPSESMRDTLLVGSDGLFDNLYLAEVVEGVRKGPLHASIEELCRLGRERMQAEEPALPCHPDDLTCLAFRLVG